MLVYSYILGFLNLSLALLFSIVILCAGFNTDPYDPASSTKGNTGGKGGDNPLDPFESFPLGRRNRPVVLTFDMMN